jgi:hypothetical protein
MAFWSIAFLGMTTFGGPIVGRFAEVAGGRLGLALGGCAALIAAGIGALKLRNIQATNINESEPQNSGKVSN